MSITVIMPVLDEKKAVGLCIQKAFKGIKKTGMLGEVIICDNGSIDGSAKIARQSGAKVIFQKNRGYGNAYIRALKEARGHYIIMGDADGSYNFEEIPKFVKLLKNGQDLVIGTRLKGSILPGAMPWSHRFIGTPILTGMLNTIFKLKLTDVSCGFRAIKSDSFKGIKLKATGMEFALEMIMQAGRNNLAICEIPITYYPRIGQSKLQPVIDGLKHFFFIIKYA